MPRKYIEMDPNDYHRLKMAAAKYKTPLSTLAIRAIMAEVERIEGIPNCPPPATKRRLSLREAAAELVEALAREPHVPVTRNP
jgi:hypothetical protein